MKLITAIVAASVLFPVFARSDTSDDTLGFFLKKSDLVIVGKIKNVPIATINEIGVVDYICDFEVSDVLKGDKATIGKIIKAKITRFEREEKDRSPLVKIGEESIVFLKNQPSGQSPKWVTADFWFGIQHPSPWMAKSLRRLAK